MLGRARSPGGWVALWGCAGAGLEVVHLFPVPRARAGAVSQPVHGAVHPPRSVALEEHFRDDDDGPVSSQGYMPYLNKYILDKVKNFDELCWTLTCCIHQDAFKLWCLFNFLSEDKYPLVMVPDEVEYLLKKICTAMNVELNSCELDDYLSQEQQGQGGLTVWQFLDMVNSGRFLRGIEQEAVSMAVEEVYQEVIEDVLKQARSPQYPVVQTPFWPPTPCF
uniref:SWAP70 N-terminal EF-hand domain-containing protein n=1 Tax=Athene cunicularia TaxID=194338 RepID=A0A663MF06_ATHCN